MAVSAKGQYKLISTWGLSAPKRFRSTIGVHLTRKTFVIRSQDVAYQTMWTDWFFGQAPSPPATGSPLRMMMGIGT